MDRTRRILSSIIVIGGALATIIGFVVDCPQAIELLCQTIPDRFTAVTGSALSADALWATGIISTSALALVLVWSPWERMFRKPTREELRYQEIQKQVQQLIDTGTPIVTRGFGKRDWIIMADNTLELWIGPRTRERFEQSRFAHGETPDIRETRLDMQQRLAFLEHLVKNLDDYLAAEKGVGTDLSDAVSPNAMSSLP